MRIPTQFNIVRHLVKIEKFDIVFGFEGASTILVQVRLDIDMAKAERRGGPGLSSGPIRVERVLIPLSNLLCPTHDDDHKPSRLVVMYIGRLLCMRDVYVQPAHLLTAQGEKVQQTLATVAQGKEKIKPMGPPVATADRKEQNAPSQRKAVAREEGLPRMTAALMSRTLCLVVTSPSPHKSILLALPFHFFMREEVPPNPSPTSDFATDPRDVAIKHLTL
ncbi:hypothetical protein F5I97DRAFT_1830351 [Phlebopus sp. FC_14]|nr:hypothetical protein F5I97DRAFT_1830351 [Phlebopus sp. FC_14]